MFHFKEPMAKRTKIIGWIGTTDLARIMEVAPITVGRWIEEKNIPFFKTPGGHRRVRLKDAIRFIKKYGPNKNIDKNMKSY
jgi:excisionase family DNA binding protein